MRRVALPESIRVKLSTEAAGAISITPVVVRDMPLRELVDHMLGVTGKDADRVRELLRRGSLVSGASRFRWSGWEASLAGIDALLASFPDADPGRPFAAAGCSLAVLRGPQALIELPREVANRRRFLRRRSFWGALLQAAAAGAPAYAGYSYKRHADCYRLALGAAQAASLRSDAGLLAYSTLVAQVRLAALAEMELYADRS